MDGCTLHVSVGVLNDSSARWIFKGETVDGDPLLI